jgi:two-component system, NtrC family, sensor histidine kinase PilS
VLGLLNLYRVLVPAVLIGITMTVGSRSLSVENHQLFISAAAAYFCFGLASILIVKQRWGTPYLQTVAQAAIDVALLMLILHACGGVASGLGLLLIVPVGALAFLLPPRSALFLAAMSVLVVLVHTFWSQLAGLADVSAYTTAGLLGAVLFVISAFSSFAAERMRTSEALVAQKDIDLANLAELSQYIVQHLRESLLVVDSADRIRLINESAAQILGGAAAAPGGLLGEVSPRLLYSLSMWRQAEGASTQPTTFVAADGAQVVQPHFASLGKGASSPTLIFLEDTSLLNERVQQGKLAALGRLSASIAHEIRNPVGAMSHAGQLLAESPNIGLEERRLTEIIQTNSERVSSIINNVLQLSRREPTRLEKVTLNDWLEEFVPEFTDTMQLGSEAIRLRSEGRPVEVRIDSTQLRQVVWNLCDNALKYANGSAGPVEVSVGRLSPSARPYLEVSDRGPGIEPAAVDRIFEPFFTGPRGGTGLGLFIARELCQLNRAVLLYEPRAGGGSTFRVVFTDPQRWTD